jgi:hypothetical protein
MTECDTYQGHEYRNIKIIMFLGSKVRLVLSSDNLTAICEAIVYTVWDH